MQERCPEVMREEVREREDNLSLGSRLAAPERSSSVGHDMPALSCAAHPTTRSPQLPLRSGCCLSEPRPVLPVPASCGHSSSCQAQPPRQPSSGQVWR